MYTIKTKEQIFSGALDATLEYIYGKAAVSFQRERYTRAIDEFVGIYGERDISLYSVAGRSELSGNHTDHNRGCVIAASVDLDIIAVASARDDGIIRIKSEGFPEDIVDTAAYTSPVKAKFGTSESIIAGICVGLKNNGHTIGGLDAYTTSNVLKGSGLSSSAAFEVMVGNILNHMYNGGRIDNVELARLAQYAENVFFGKPCGLMDQVACAVGGIVAIDFANPAEPVIDKFDFDLSAHGYSLCIVNTGGNHANLTDDYAAIPAEMKAVAAYFGKSALRELGRDELLGEIPALRDKVGDRAILRALHFMNENERVEAQKAALINGDLDAFLSLVKESSHSSFCYLQNVYTTKELTKQGLSLALCLAEQELDGMSAACRVHGGGFAGTIQCYVPMCAAEGFRTFMNGIFGEGRCTVLRIRPIGATRIF